MRSAVAGWVEKRRAMRAPPPKGLTMKRLAVAGCAVAEGTTLAASSSRASALASASGSPEISAPASSARYSREREMPS
jgi:hypothetical protein